MTLWGISTVGSARHSHCRGQGVDSPMLHKKRPPFTGGSFFVPHRVVKPRDRRQCGALERESRLRPPVEEISQAAFSTDKEWISTMWSHDYIGCGTGVRLLAVVGCSPLCHTPQRALIYKDRSFFVFGQCSDFCTFGFMIALYALICKARRHLTGTL